MPYTTATPIPPVNPNSDMTLVVFTGPGETKRDIEAPAGVDLKVWAKARLAELNTKKAEQGKVVLNAPLDLSDPPKTALQTAQENFAVDFAALQRANTYVAAGLTVSKLNALKGKAQGSFNALDALLP